MKPSFYKNDSFSKVNFLKNIKTSMREGECFGFVGHIVNIVMSEG